MLKFVDQLYNVIKVAIVCSVLLNQIHTTHVYTQNDPASIDRQIDKTLDKSVAATTRIIETVLDTEDIAGQTAAKLHEQGKQIDGIHAKVVGIEEGAREARIEASKLEWCGCWYRCCHGKKAYTRSSGNSNDGAVTSEPRPHSMGGRITEKILENDSREKKIEDNLQ